MMLLGHLSVPLRSSYAKSKVGGFHNIKNIKSTQLAKMFSRELHPHILKDSSGIRFISYANLTCTAWEYSIAMLGFDFYRVKERH